MNNKLCNYFSYIIMSCSVSLVFLTDEVVRLVRGFASNWKGSIESLNRDVMRQFTNFRNGTGILQVDVYWSVYYNISTV